MGRKKCPIIEQLVNEFGMQRGTASTYKQACLKAGKDPIESRRDRGNGIIETDADSKEGTRRLFIRKSVSGWVRSNRYEAELYAQDKYNAIIFS